MEIVAKAGRSVLEGAQTKYPGRVSNSTVSSLLNLGPQTEAAFILPDESGPQVVLDL